MNTISMHSKINIEKTVAKLYLYFLPFNMFTPFGFMSSIFIGFGKRASFLLMLVGLTLLVFQRKRVKLKRDESNSLIRYFVRMYLICDLTSLAMAAVLYSDLGTIGGENTFDAVLPKIVFSLMYMIILFYNRELFRLLSKEEIEHVFDGVITICILFGMWQIGVLFVGGPFTSSYNAINTLFGAWDSSSIQKTGRIALLTNEPASIAGFMGILVVPFLLSKWLTKPIEIVDVVKMILLVVVLYFTKSTTGYSLFIVDFILFIYFYIGSTKNNITTRIIKILLLAVVVAIIVFVVSNNDVVNNISNVFDKLLNSDNTSSTNRKAGLYVDWGVIKEYPLFGVGNGNQGFYYQKYYPKNMLSSELAYFRYNNAANTLYDGGVFFAAFASGYGVLGVLLLAVFAKKSFSILKRNKEIFGFLYYFYCIASISLLLYGFSSTMASEFAPWFIISVPLAIQYWKINLDTSETQSKVNVE